MMEFVSWAWDDEIPNIWKVIIHSYSKPALMGVHGNFAGVEVSQMRLLVLPKASSKS